MAAARLGEVGPGGVGAQELALHVLLHPLQDAVLVQEVDLVLRGVHVDIHILRADF